MTYPDALRFLHGLNLFGARFGLENTRKLASLAGNPQDRLRFIHVAGTNGKGSTCAMIEGIYRAVGLRVGLYTSPHLVALNERIQINRQPIAEPEVVRLVEAAQRDLAAWGDGLAESHPTFFEVVTVMALRYFAERACDLVVWETGLGGRLDATNIITPLASVITNIQYDHRPWLGDTLAQIATEKAGIIKPGVPVLTAADAPEAFEVIARVARAQSAPLTRITAGDLNAPPLAGQVLPLRGQHQRLNAALALATVQVLQEHFPVPLEVIPAALAGLVWDGRFQVCRRPNGRILVLDGAHNPAAMAVLVETLRAEFPGSLPTWVLGILRDKEWTVICRTLAPWAGRILLVPVASGRSTDPEQLRVPCRETNPTAEIIVCRSLAEGLEHAETDSLVVVAGSLYLVGEALEQLRLAPVQASSERGLNEWTAPASHLGHRSA